MSASLSRTHVSFMPVLRLVCSKHMMTVRMSGDATGHGLILTLGNWDEVEDFPAVSTIGLVSDSILNRSDDYRHFNIHTVG